jgi:hypothetical protein
MPAPPMRTARTITTSEFPPCDPNVDFWVFYLDSAGPNFMFRGGMPIVDGQIAYDELIGKFQAAATASGKTLPPQPYYIVDVSLVQVANCGNDRTNIQIEFNYWNTNPNLGQLRYWETDGIQIDPNDPTLQQPFRDSLVSSVPSWLPDNLDARVDQLHSWLQNGLPGVNMPVIVYVHCEGGCDRTGELSGAYGLKYLNMTWSQINDMNHADCYGGCTYFGCGNFYAAHWYCYWLNPSAGRDLGCAAPATCNGPAPPCTSSAVH